MPLRLYEFARETNYPIADILQKADFIISTSPLSLVPDSVVEKLRAQFPAKEEHPCITRVKLKKKRKAPVKKSRKVAAKLVEEEHQKEEEKARALLESQNGETLPGVTEDSGESSDVVTNETTEKASPIQEKIPKKKAEDVSLGKVGQGKIDDTFRVGRIVSDAKEEAKPNHRKKVKRTLEQRLDSQTLWDQKYNESLRQGSSKSTKTETRGSKLQRMKLVFGHEIPVKERAKTSGREQQEKDTTIYLPVNIRDLSETLGIISTDVIKFLMAQGMFMTITDNIEIDVAELIAKQFKKDVLFSEEKKEEELIREITGGAKADNLKPRSPVITIMGHVDHGKTTLLDAIRSSKVVEGESGGITQHIGGYQVEKDGKMLTFLDTPGHAAFTTMRARGANLTDLIILVVAADDGMKPQTEEAINHAKAAGVPVIVAMNKMDKPGANVDKIKEQLATLELIPEEWSGSTAYCPISAINGEGLDNLLEMINLQADMLELKADYDCPAEGVVIESHLETGRGVVAHLLIKQGILKKGAPILCGVGHGLVRQILDENGKDLKEAGPSQVIKITGLSTCPAPGDSLNVLPNKRKAKDLAEERMGKTRESELTQRRILNTDDILAKLADANAKNMNVIIKGDVQGSVEALEQALSELGNEEASVKIVHRGVGAISESDVVLAKTSDSVIFGFHITADSKTRKLAVDEEVEIRNYDIIYELIHDVKNQLEGMLEPDKTETHVGEIEVREVFKISNVGVIAGCYVRSGYAERGIPVRLTRDGTVVYTGKIQTVKRFKDDVKRVEQRYECGIRLDNYEDMRTGDLLEPYTIEMIAKKLD